MNQRGSFMVKEYAMILFGLQACIGYAQNNSGRNLPTSFFIPFVESSLTEVVGDPYLSKDWSQGTIHTANGTFEGLLLRFNIASDILEHKRGTFTMYFDKKALDEFTINTPEHDRRFRFMDQGQVRKKSRIGYYEVVSLGQDSTELFIKHRKNLYEADLGAYSIQETPEYRYEPKLLVLKDNLLVKARLTNKLCEDHFGMPKAKVEEVLMTLGISLDD
ncbi:MAG: hypothetical protein AAGA85_01150 [Bacteroidota bacterium]